MPSLHSAVRVRIFCTAIKICSGTPYGGQRRTQALTDRAGALTGHQARTDTHPGVVIDPGQGFGAGAISQRKAAHRRQTTRRPDIAAGHHGGWTAHQRPWHHACGKAYVQPCFDQVSGPLVHHSPISRF
jgi:hypothetical protein